MSLAISKRVSEGITILDMKGRLTVGDGSSLLRQTVAELLEEGTKGVILNMQEVDYVDSSGLGAMVLVHTQAEEAGAALKLLNPSGRNIELIVMTRLETVFQTFDEERDAVNSFFPNREIKRFDILDFVKKQKKQGSGV